MVDDRYSKMTLEELVAEHDKRVLSIASPATLAAMNYIKAHWLVTLTESEREVYALNISARLRQDDRVNRLAAMRRRDTNLRGI